MIAYVGQTRSAALVRTLEALGVRECCTRGELPPRRYPWFYDNGAYADAVAGEPFNMIQFWRDCNAIRLWQDEQGIPEYRRRGGERLRAPDFLVLPDEPWNYAGGDSLGLSLAWLRGEWFELPPGVPAYLAVQDGMSCEQIADVVHQEPGIGGLFVGGSLPWKLRTGGAWCELGRRLGLPVHIGRVGTADRVAWARECGASSIDSCLPLWSSGHLGPWIEALSDNASQGRLTF